MTVYYLYSKKKNTEIWKFSPRTKRRIGSIWLKVQTTFKKYTLDKTRLRLKKREPIGKSILKRLLGMTTCRMPQSNARFPGEMFTFMYCSSVPNKC